MTDTAPLKDVAEAVSGPGTPAAAAMVSKPPEKAVWGLVLAGPAISLMVVGCIWVLAAWFWPDVVRLKALGVMEHIVLAVASIATILVVILGVIVFRLASGGLKRIEAKAGPGSVSIETGAGD
jgi:hypothetical protein